MISSPVRWRSSSTAVWSHRSGELAYALYDRSLASFGESGGEFSQHASPGFMELFTMQSRLAHRIREEAEE